ncbi:MAG: nickel pincer cofactor biosynthesis protein LarB [Acidobacteriota bacterium]
MNRDRWLEVFEAVRKGAMTPEEALSRVSHLPYEDLGFARIDHHRLLRRGFPEAIFGEGKTAGEVARILQSFRERSVPALVTRLDGAKARAVKRAVPGFVYHPRSRLGYLGPAPGEGEGSVVVVSGGSSDAPVAEEAFLTARYLGARAELHPDVGVAGLHRVTALLPSLGKARAVVAVAGMEGALPSVVAGLTGALVIGVPTSIGYGVQDSGKTPLFAMLASCVPGLVVVNVDAGFSAGYAAAVINRAEEAPAKRKPVAGGKAARRPR